MKWHDLILSRKSRYRYTRHLLCWTLWLLYIVFTIFATKQAENSIVLNHYQPGLRQLGYFYYTVLVILKSILLLIIHLFFCYSFIYLVLPKFFLQKKYWIAAGSVLLLNIATISLGYLLYSRVYPWIDNFLHLKLVHPDKLIIWKSIDASLVNAIKLTLLVAAITLLRHWWQKQKEKEQLEREKITAELDLLKAQIHPNFLFSSLNNIINQAKSGSPNAPELLIKLADILSYMLYESDEPKVKLEKEITILQDYIALEQFRQSKNIEITFQVKGKVNGQIITPLILLPFIEISFSHCNYQSIEQPWINLDITIENENLSMKLINGIPTERFADDAQTNDEHFYNVRKRLQLLYPENHELRISLEQEMLVVYLYLKLDNEQVTIVQPAKAVLSHV